MGALVFLGVRRIGGGFAYALDDAYIHLAIGRNLAEAGTWGVLPTGFSGASSSPLWTLLLAGVTLIVGDRVLTPLFLNVLFGSLLLVVAEGGLRRHGVPPLARVGVLLVLILITPMAVMVVSGMEHLFQAFLAMAFVLIAARVLSVGQASTRERALLLVLAFLLVGLRYEDAFLVGVVAVAAFLRGWRLFAVALLAVGAAPALLYGLYSVAHGWPFLPSSIIAKATPLPTRPVELYRFGHAAVKRLLLAPHLLVLVVLALGLLAARVRRSPWSEPDLLLSFFAGAALLHPVFAMFGWFYRYEAYLMALGVVALAVGVRDLVPPGGLRAARLPPFRAAVLLVLVLVAALSVSMRMADAHISAPAGMDNIHDQHLQMALFLREHYAGEMVAINDIGAVSYMSGVRILDLWGLGDKDVAQAVREKRLTTDALRQLAEERNASIAILHDHIFAVGGGVPPEWELKGTWTIRDNHVTVGDVLSFYALKPGEGERLERAMAEFAPRLPADVVSRPG